MKKYLKKHLILISLISCFTFTPSWAFDFKIEKWETSNGARVVFYQAMQVPMLDVNVAFAAGSAYDGQNFGLSTLTANLIDKGNGSYNANQIADSLAQIGAQYGAGAKRDMSLLHLRTLTEPQALNAAIKTFALIINHPNFPSAELAREKSQLLMAIEQKKESPEDTAFDLFFRTLYRDHPYAHPVEGTKETVSALDQGRVKHFYQQYYTGSNAVLVIVGAISSQQAHDISKALVESLPKGQKAAPIPTAKPLTDAETLRVPFPSSQTIIRLGQRGIDYHNPDYFPLLVGNYTLGGGALVSRLATEVREKRGLSYGVSSQFLPMPGDGPFVIGLSTKTSQAPLALQVTQETLQSFLQTGPTAEELLAAKKYLTGSFPLSLASNANIANILLKMNFYQLPDDYLDTYIARIEKVTLEDIKQAFNRLIHPDKMVLISVGQQPA